MEDIQTTEKQGRLDHEASSHICAVSGGMVGVCLTTIGLIRVIISLRNVGTLADDLLALDAILFLVATLSSYWALRTRHAGRLHGLERLADCAFIGGMVLMAGICLFITYFIGGL